MTDWKTLELGQVCTLQRGMDLPKRMRTEGDFPLVTSSGIDGTHSIGPVEGPGVITGRYGTIGKVFFVESAFWPLNTTLYVRDFHGNDPRFIHYLLQTVDFQSHSGKSGVPGINRNDVHQEFVHVPVDCGEQESVAQTLLNADTLIDSLEQLLTKKRQIKQGAMQELLTGKRRLPGFSRSWQRVQLSQLGTFLKGAGVKRDEAASGDLPCVRYGEIYTEHSDYIRAFRSWISLAVAATATRLCRGDPVAFAMEKHLEDFLVKNWAQTELAQAFKIYEEDGELVGQQYGTDVGPIDILAISRDGQRLLVVELKRGRASDVVVGQILRYMGYVKEQIAEPHQTVEGAIIALDDDQKLRWALLAVPSISFYRYQVSFKLIKH